MMALAEADYRRATIDAGTASEVAFASAISELLEAEELNREYIDQTIRRADGFDVLFSLHLSFGRPKPISRNAPVSRNAVITQLANVRNDSAHAGRIPSIEEATRAVELAHALVITAHPFAERVSAKLPGGLSRIVWGGVWHSTAYDIGPPSDRVTK
jgi:hypothetical protein